MFSGSSLKRVLVYEKGALLRQLSSLRRVVRIHCIFDTNAKMQVIRKDSGEVVFGSRDLDPHGFEQRVMVFECDDFAHVKDPVTFDPSSLNLDEVFPQELPSTKDPKATVGEVPHQIKGHRRKLMMKK